MTGDMVEPGDYPRSSAGCGGCSGVAYGVGTVGCFHVHRLADPNPYVDSYLDPNVDSNRRNLGNNRWIWEMK